MGNKRRLSTAGRLLRYSLLGVLAFAAASVFLTIILLSTDRVTAPAWVQEAADRRIKQAIGDSSVATGTITLSFDPLGFALVLHIHEIALKGRDGNPLADLKDIRVASDAAGLVRGRFEIKEVTANEVDLWLPAKPLASAAAGEPPHELAAAQAPFPIGSLFENLGLALDGLNRSIGDKLSKISVASLDVHPRDATSREWSIRNGLVSVARSESGFSAQASLNIGRGGGKLLPFSASLSSASSPSGLSIKAESTEVDVLDIAGDLLGTGASGNLPASGSLAVDFDAQGEMTRASASIRTRAASLDLPGENGPGSLEIRLASAQIVFDPSLDRLSIASLEVDSNVASINARGHAYARGAGLAVPTIEGSLQFEEAVVKPSGIFEEELRNLAGVLDFRLAFSPLNLEVMRFSLTDAEATLAAAANIASAGDGFRISSDFSADRLPSSKLLAFWPLLVVPNTREWMDGNFAEGEVHDVNGAVRIETGSSPELLVTYKFRDMRLNFLGELPAVEDGEGYGVITLGDAFVGLDAGTIGMPESERIDLSGTSLTIPDSTDPRVPARIELNVSGPVIPILTVLNQRPLMLLDKGGLRSDFATGSASGISELRFPLLKNVALEDVEVKVSGMLENVVAADLLGGKTFRADQLDISADSAALSVSGSGTLGDLPISGAWNKAYSGESGGESTIKGSIELSERFLGEFGIELPGDPISGAGTASFELKGDAGSKPVFSIASDLRGLGTDVPTLNWRKAPEEEGALIVEGTLSEPMALSKIELSASGLEASGKAQMRSDGGFEKAEFASFRIDEWLDISLELQSSKSLAITGGFLDTSLVEPSGRNPESDAAAGGEPVGVLLDRVRISDSIELSDFIGEFKFDGAGAEGGFTASINGLSKIRGTIAPYEGGSEINIQSEDAGSVLRASGIIQNLYDGTLRLKLLPLDGTGKYRGRAIITESRVKDMPALGELLNYVSIVGILDQLAGEGVHFSEVTADFEIGEEGIELLQGIAMGSSIGITMAGNYELESERMSMEGMLTPFFALNQLVGAITPLQELFGIEEGEGFGGIYFTMRGPAMNPVVQIDPSSVLTPGILDRIFRPNRQ